MLKVIIKKEIVDTITSPKFLFTFLLCAILIFASVYTGISNYRTQQSEYEGAVALNKKSLESQPNYAMLAGYGTKINRKPQILSMISTGIEEAMGQAATVNISYDPTLVDSKFSSNPMSAVYGALDLTFIVKIVLSLFALLFTYDAIAGEKERGTLKLMLANSLPRHTLILGKAIGGYISLVIPLLIPLLLSLVFLMVFPDVSLTGADWFRLSLIFVIFFLYLSLFFTLGLFVSTRTGRSSTSFLILLFLWILFVTIIPKAAVMSAEQIYPIPTIHEITAKKEAFLRQANTEFMQQQLDFWKELEREGKNLSREEMLTKSRTWMEERNQKKTARVDEFNLNIERDFQAKKRQQQRLAVDFSRISPASALTFSTMSLARTGIDEYERFLNSLKTYKPIFSKWVNARIMRGLEAGQLAKVELETMPSFNYTPESLGPSIKRVLPDIGIMTALIVLFFIGAHISFLAYDAR